MSLDPKPASSSHFSPLSLIYLSSFFSLPFVLKDSRQSSRHGTTHFRLKLPVLYIVVVGEIFKKKKKKILKHLLSPPTTVWSQGKVFVLIMNSSLELYSSSFSVTSAKSCHFQSQIVPKRKRKKKKNFADPQPYVFAAVYFQD